MLSALDQSASMFSLSQANRAEARAQNLAAQLASGSLGGSTGSANQAIAQALDTEQLSALQANQNALQGASVYATADGALSTLQDLTSQMRALAVQSGNATLTPANRQAIDAAYQQLGQEVDRVAATTSFNGTPLLSGAPLGSFQVGTSSGAASQLAVNLPTVSSANLGLAGSGVATSAAAGQSLDRLDGAISQLSVARSGLGASEAALGSAQDVSANQAQQAAAAYTRVGATDYAAATAAYQMALLGEQAAYGANLASRNAAIRPMAAIVA